LLSPDVGGGYGQKLRNNLSFKSRVDLAKFDAAKSDAANNSFTLNLKPTAADFLSLDESDLTRPRQANGDLPAIKFLHLAESSALIDKGEEIGFPFKGAKPDLGAFEKQIGAIGICSSRRGIAPGATRPKRRPGFCVLREPGDPGRRFGPSPCALPRRGLSTGKLMPQTLLNPKPLSRVLYFATDTLREDF